MVGKVVSLSHPISPRIPLWPGDPPVEFEDVASLEQDDYFLRRFSMGEHSATHMNAPNSYFADGMGIEGYQPQDLVRPAVVIDVRAQSTPDYEISVQDIVERVGTSQSNISQHLALMREKGVLQTRRDANRVYYRLADVRMLEVIGMVRDAFCGF